MWTAPRYALSIVVAQQESELELELELTHAWDGCCPIPLTVQRYVIENPSSIAKSYISPAITAALVAEQEFDAKDSVFRPKLLVLILLLFRAGPCNLRCLGCSLRSLKFQFANVI